MDGTIDEVMLSRFMDFCNNNGDEKCTIVINSGGGKSTIATVILDMINSNSKKFTLVSAGCYSAAFYIFYFSKCKRKLVHGSLGMHHKEYLKGICINSDRKPFYDSDKCEIKNLKSIDDSFSYKFLSKKEAKMYDKSYDIYFTFKRMTEIFPGIEIIK